MQAGPEIKLYIFFSLTFQVPAQGLSKNADRFRSQVVQLNLDFSTTTMYSTKFSIY